MPVAFPLDNRLRRVGVNTNMDGNPPAGYYNDGGSLAAFTAANPNFNSVREGNTGAFAVGASASGDAFSFTNFNARLDLPWFTAMGGRLVYQCHAGRYAPYTAAAVTGDGDATQDALVWSSAKLDNAAYVFAGIAGQYPNYRGRRGIWAWLMINEADLNMTQVCRLALSTGARKTTAIQRLVALQKRWWQTLQTHPGVVMGLTTSTQALRRDHTVEQFRIDELLTYNNGEVLNYMRAHPTTFHHLQSNLSQPGFTASGPANGEVSLYWAWLAMKEARALNPSAPKRPICCTEYGVSAKLGHFGTAPTSGDWITDDDTKNGKQILRSYRFGLAALATFWWAVPYTNLYSLAYSDADLSGGSEPATSRGTGYGTQNIFWDSGSGALTAYQPAADTIRSCFDQRRYKLPIGGQIPIVAKTWKSFHLPYSWAVAARLDRQPTSTSLDVPPQPSWGAVTIANDLITSAAGYEQCVSRPLVLPTWTKYTAKAQVKCDSGGVANLCARGYDFTDGLAYVRSANASAAGWTTLTVEFTTVGHGVPQLPDVPSVVLVAYHNGVGSMQARYFRVFPSGSTDPGPIVPDDTGGGGGGGGTTGAYCRTPANANNLFAKPFNQDTSHMRPVGVNAVFGGATHAKTISLIHATGTNINVPSAASGWGDPILYCDPSYPQRTVVWRPPYDSKSQFPITLRIADSFTAGPANQDATATLYDPDTQLFHEFYGLARIGGQWQAMLHRVQRPRLIGHTPDSAGTSASGMPIIAGLVRGDEWNNADDYCEHCLNISLSARPGDLPDNFIQLSKNWQWPATSRDGFAANPGNNTGVINYGERFAIPSYENGGPNPANLALGAATSRRYKLYYVLRNYGLLVHDASGGNSIRSDQYLSSTAAAEIKTAFAAFKPLLRPILNVRNTDATTGGGDPIPGALNCAYNSGSPRKSGGGGGGGGGGGDVKPVTWWESKYSMSADYAYAYPRSTSGSCFSHYELARCVDGNTAMFRATGKTIYLDRALLYVENVIATSRTSAEMGSQYAGGSTKTYRGWAQKGAITGRTVGYEYPLDDFYLWRYVCTLLAAMKGLTAYTTRYNNILAFTELHMWEKWWLRGPKDTTYRNVIHISSHAGQCALILAELTTDATRRSQYIAARDNIDHLGISSYGGGNCRDQMDPHPSVSDAYTWGMYWKPLKVSEPNGSDVNHGNGFVGYLVEAKDRGYGWTDSDITKFKNLFTKWIWTNASEKKAWLKGSLEQNPGDWRDGFFKLGRYDAALQQRLEGHISTASSISQLWGVGALSARILRGKYD